MIDSKIKLAKFLTKTADRIEEGADYSWGHLGKCNCGHLIQTITQLSPASIHRVALHPTGEWTELANDYCPTSGLEMNSLIESLLDAGISNDEIRHLEHLDDPKILKRLPKERSYLERNSKVDAILYFRIWAEFLKEDVINSHDEMKQKVSLRVEDANIQFVSPKEFVEL
jgi:hypothetical protein